ncbi:MAG: TVP38/TMEM64 family protein [Cyanobacteria bacterium P01_G01_bin.49]
MIKNKSVIVLLLIFCVVATIIGIVLLRKLDPENLQVWLAEMGIWAPILYIILYTIATLFILPSTPLNLTGGVLFGIWWGTLWTTIAALLAAMIAFGFTRTIGRDYMSRKLAGKWEAIEGEMYHGGLFYIFAIRLMPIIPYGIVNFAAGLTSIRFRDYFLGTTAGTLPGILPFVMMGAGFQSLSQGDIMPLLFALMLIGILVGGGTWYSRRRQFPKKAEKMESREDEENMNNEQ